LPVISIIQPAVEDHHVYDAVRHKIDLDKNHPDGLILHAVGEIDGAWRIINIWESADYAERWERDTLVPAAREILGEAASRRVVKTFGLHHLITP
jgi:hypothetical protein